MEKKSKNIISKIALISLASIISGVVIAEELKTADEIKTIIHIKNEKTSPLIHRTEAGKGKTFSKDSPKTGVEYADSIIDKDLTLNVGEETNYTILKHHLGQESAFIITGKDASGPITISGVCESLHIGKNYNITFKDKTVAGVSAGTECVAVEVQ